MINLVDVMILVLGVCFITHGVVRGFIRELMAMIGLLAAVIMAFLYTPWLFPYCSQWIHTPFFVFLLVFVVTLFVCAVLGEIFSRFIRFVGLSFLNAVLGGVLGLVRTLFWLVLVIFFLQYGHLEHYPIVQASVILRQLSPWCAALFQKSPHWLVHWQAIDMSAVRHVVPLFRMS